MGFTNILPYFAFALTVIVCASDDANVTTSISVEAECDTFNNSSLCCDTSLTVKCSFCVGNVSEGTCRSSCNESNETDSCVLSTIPSPTETPTTSSSNNSDFPTTSITTPRSDSSASGSEGQHFDGASFIGGIVLCGGLIAIIFFGLKFYKARKEQNYRTL